MRTLDVLVACVCACPLVVCALSWRASRLRRRRMHDAVVDHATDVLARVARVQGRAAEVLACIQSIGSVPGVDAAKMRGELRDIQFMLSRASALHRAADLVLATSTQGGLPRSMVLEGLLAEVRQYDRRLAAIEDSLHDRQVLLAHSRTLLVAHAFRPVAAAACP